MPVAMTATGTPMNVEKQDAFHREVMVMNVCIEGMHDLVQDLVSEELVSGLSMQWGRLRELLEC